MTISPLARPAGVDALTVRGLRVDYGDPGAAIPAVRGIDLDVPAGAIVALLGESGSGKSATARAVLGLDQDGSRIAADEIRIGSTDLLRASDEQRRRARGSEVGLVMQDALSALNPVLSIGRQLGELFEVHLGLSRRKARSRAVEMLGLVGIPDPARRVDDYPHQFSGGMRQRILIAMAIALEPTLLIADEPTTALDVTVQAQILDLLDDLRMKTDMGVLLITHDLGVVNEVADRVVVMYAGRVVESGVTAAVFTHPAHPYTQALLRSVPQASGRREDLLTIAGSPPSPRQVPSGCSFRTRCRWAVELCADRRPELAGVAEGRLAACHRSAEVLDVAVG
ncbi:ABC transporter ATP-binding protein [Nakamurella lactea]|uniref:ABC transporter ATP-binding protein n=1 Tax=Nakamurella lactea TaxID=459515 RepID=UPI0004117133|nr:ABC transporter ATP-binding protein [Nakamurella lactea]